MPKTTLEDKITEAVCLADQISSIAYSGFVFLIPAADETYDRAGEIFLGIEALCKKLSEDLSDLAIKGRNIEL